MIQKIIAFIVEHWETATLLIFGLYDVIVRLIPTVGNYSVISWIIKLIHAIDNLLNVKPKK